MLYYTPPSQEIFNDVKTSAKMIWHFIDSDNDKYGYASEKCARIDAMENVGDNFMTIVAMFDIYNQVYLSRAITPESRKAVRDRLISTGGSSEYNNFKS